MALHNNDMVVLQLHLMFGDDIVGKDSHNELYGNFQTGFQRRAQLMNHRANDASKSDISHRRDA